MVNRVTCLFLGAVLLGGAATSAFADDSGFHSLSDAYVYDKPSNDLDGKWKDEIGVGSQFYTKGPWLIKWNAGYVHTFPKAFNVAPGWTVGASAVYELMRGPVIPGLYTKTKNNLNGEWQQEFGVTALSKVGKVGLVFQAGYVAAYPWKFDIAPTWQVSVSAQFHFR